MANIECLPQIGICALRISELESSGVPLPGSSNLMTVNSVIDLAWSTNTRAGQSIQEENGCGDLCVDYEQPDTVRFYDVTINVCDHNPYVMAALGRGDVLNNSGVHGYAFPPLGTVPTDQVSVEFWTKRIDDGALHDQYPYAWWVLPLMRNLHQGDDTKNSGAAKPQFLGRAYENSNWFNGPLNDWPVASDRAIQWIPTATLPTVSCTPSQIPVS